MFQQDPIQIIIKEIDSVGCIGTNTASINVNIRGGKFQGPNYYDLYLKDSNSDTIRWIDRDSNAMSPNIDTTISLHHIKVIFDSLGVGDYTLHVEDPFGCTAVSNTITISPLPIVMRYYRLIFY